MKKFTFFIGKNTLMVFVDKIFWIIFYWEQFVLYIFNIYRMSNETKGVDLKSAAQNVERKLFIETYGCQMNVADSEVVASIMEMDGYAVTNKIEEADAIFVNTCSVRDNAEQKDTNTTHNRTGDAMDESSNLSYEGKDNGQYCRAAHDPDAVDARNGHDAHVFTVGRIRRGTDETRNDIG